MTTKIHRAILLFTIAAALFIVSLIGYFYSSSSFVMENHASELSN